MANEQYYTKFVSDPDESGNQAIEYRPIPPDSLNTDPESLLYLIAKMMAGQTSPLRQQQVSIFEQLLSGTYDPRTSPQYGPSFSQGKEDISNAYEAQMGNILQGPRGGQMLQGLASAEAFRSEQDASLPAFIASQIIGDQMARATGVAFGTPLDQSIAGLGNTAYLKAQKDVQAIQNSALTNAAAWGTAGDLGSAAGLAYGTYNPYGNMTINPRWGNNTPYGQQIYGSGGTMQYANYPRRW